MPNSLQGDIEWWIGEAGVVPGQNLISSLCASRSIEILRWSPFISSAIQLYRIPFSWIILAHQHQQHSHSEHPSSPSPSMLLAAWPKRCLLDSSTSEPKIKDQLDCSAHTGYAQRAGIIKFNLKCLIFFFIYSCLEMYKTCSKIIFQSYVTVFVWIPIPTINQNWRT